ncbi:MAG: C25 family cysteine peptidase [Chloroflexota bacterium]|nr:C25 family cysteine peptidase [Chloroflexota bacterium]
MKMLWMHRTRFIFILILSSFFLGTTLFSQAALTSAVEPGPVFDTDKEGLTLVWTLPQYRLTATREAVAWYSQIEMEGLVLSEQPGHPQLPVYSALVGLPPTGEVWLRVVEVVREIVPLPHLPLPAPVTRPVHLSPDGQPVFSTDELATRVPDPTVYAADALYPDAVVRLGLPQWVRGRRVALLTVSPVRVNPVTRQMEVVRSLHLEVVFERPVLDSSSSYSPAQGRDPFAQVLASTLVNPTAAHWQNPRLPEDALIQYTNIITGSPFKVVVDEAGLYALTYDDLANTGLPVDSLDPRALRLTHGLARQEIAIQVEGEGDGVFDPGDRVLFYAEPEFSRFADTGVYLLDYGQTNGLRMDTRSGDPGGLPSGIVWRTAQAETNHHYESRYAGRDGDHWYWDNLRQPDRTLGTYAIWLDAPLSTVAAPTATLTLWLQGYTDPIQNPDHRVLVSMADTLVGEVTWDGATAVETSVSVPASLLHDGENQITLSLPGVGVTTEGLWLDAFRLIYPSTGRAGSDPVHFRGGANPQAYTLTGWNSPDLSIYDITDPVTPRQVSGYNLVSSGGTHTLILGDDDAYTSTYLVVTDDQTKTPLALQAADILDGPPGADYVIITHPALAAAVAPLAAHRETQGWTVAVVDVDAIYDTYGAGRMSPEAIRAFLQHAYNTGTAVIPMYVLLVGDGSYDFKNFSGGGVQNLIPPYLADVDPELGETAADNRYACVDGDDVLPDLLLGRLPVKTAEEAQIVVNKIIQYEMNPFPGGWNADVLLVADDADHGGDFASPSDSYAASQVIAPFTVTRHYCAGSDPAVSDCSTQDTEALRTAILADWNRGALLIQFTGHSSWQQWAAERFFHLDDLPVLRNGQRLPIVLEMTCFTAAFQRPEPTLDEALVTLEGGGAVAAWGGTGLGVGTGHHRLSAGFFNALFTSQTETLGEATLAGKLILASTGQNLDLLDTYVLLGDPALEPNRLLVPWKAQLFLPLVECRAGALQR